MKFSLNQCKNLVVLHNVLTSNNVILQFSLHFFRFIRWYSGPNGVVRCFLYEWHSFLGVFVKSWSFPILEYLHYLLDIFFNQIDDLCICWSSYLGVNHNLMQYFSHSGIFILLLFLFLVRFLLFSFGALLSVWRNFLRFFLYCNIFEFTRLLLLKYFCHEYLLCSIQIGSIFLQFRDLNKLW